MNIHPALLFCFLSALQDGNIGLINAEIHSFTGTEGQNITVECRFNYTGRRTYFCKDECKEAILKMYNVRAQSGRYIMEYKNTSAGSRLDVTITQLTKSDSGRYGCGLEKLLKDPYMEFQIIVKDAPSTSKPNVTLRPSLRSVQSASTPPTTQSFRRSNTTSFSAETTNQSEEQQPETPAGGSGSISLIFSVTAVVVLLAVCLPLLHKWKKRGSSNNVNSRAPLTSTNMEPVYENSAPVSTLEDYENVNPASTYETLNPITMAQDQTYSTLNRATQE